MPVGVSAAPPTFTPKNDYSIDSPEFTDERHSLGFADLRVLTRRNT
jgi:hypothetical protein